MSKLSKLTQNPRQFLIDAAKKRLPNISQIAGSRLSAALMELASSFNKSNTIQMGNSPKEVNILANPIVVPSGFDQFCSVDFLKDQIADTDLLEGQVNFVFINLRTVFKEKVQKSFKELDRAVFFLDLVREDFISGLGLKKVDAFFLKNQAEVSSLYFSYFLGLANKNIVFVFIEQYSEVFGLVTRAVNDIGFKTLYWKQSDVNDFFITNKIHKNSCSFITYGDAVVASHAFSDDCVTYSVLYDRIFSDLQTEKFLNFLTLPESCIKVALFLDCPIHYSVSKFKSHVNSIIQEVFEKKEKSSYVFFLVGSDFESLINLDLYSAIKSDSSFVMISDHKKLIDSLVLAEICDVAISANIDFLAKASAFGADTIYLNSMNALCPLILSPFKDREKKLIDEKIENSICNLIEPLENKKNIKLNMLTNDKPFFKNLISNFDGKSYLIDCSGTFEKILKPDSVCASEFGKNALETTNMYLCGMLDVAEIIQSNPKEKNTDQLLKADFFVQWGIKPTNTKKWQNEVRKTLFKPLIILEDGFVRSIDIGLSGSAGLSIILDEVTSYYDATRPSGLEVKIQSGRDVSKNELENSKKLIKKIVDNKISKYNHAPFLSLKVGNPNRPKILLIDQRYGDQSVESGLGSPQSFDSMLRDAMNDYKDYDILIKQHPDAILGGKSSYFSEEKMEFSKYTDNIFIINFDVNPYCLFDLVEEVFVCTSGMGFEALLAGKKVRCYGVPFYSGWGLTTDQQKISRRDRNRSLEEIFYFSYVENSRYFNPATNKRCELDELIDYIVSVRGW